MPYRNDVLLLSGLPRMAADGPAITSRGKAAVFTGVHPKKTLREGHSTGIRWIRSAARKPTSQGKTRFASLELGCEDAYPGRQLAIPATAGAHSNSISWRAPSAPNPPEIRPRAVFERMFGAADEEKDPARRRRLQGYEKSILDAVLSDAQSLKTTLGGSDRRQVDEYLSAIRDIEKRIQTVEKDNAHRVVNFPTEALSGSVPTDFTEHSRIMFDLMTLAFQTDLTRVVTVLLAIEQSPRNYPEIGITEGHHGLTHHQGDKGKIEKVTRINEYHVKQFTYLLDKLKATTDGDARC